MKEWLLVVWLGTSTNFTVLGYHWSHQECDKQRMVLESQLDHAYVIICTQDLREGRSLYPKPIGSQGLVK